MYILINIIILLIILRIFYLIKKNYKNEKHKFLSFILNLPYWVIVLSFIALSYLYLSILSRSYTSNEIVNSNLENNLTNLNGQWGWTDKKQRETFWLLICSSDGFNGTYKIYSKTDDWGSKSASEIVLRESGSYTLEEGYDMYGDKAYVATNKQTRERAFLITQIDNRYALDWMIRLATVEDDMFGKKMEKITNDCSDN